MDTVLPGPVQDARAGDLLRRYHERFAGSPELPVPVDGITEDLLGLSVGESDALEVSGMLLPAERRIWLSATETDERRRFTLAHEVGHWVCQCLEGRGAPIYCRSEEVGVGAGRQLEREANVFAAELLMPEPAIREDAARGLAVPELSHRFGVSPEAMSWRLYNFGLLDQPPTQSAKEGVAHS